MPHFYGYPGQSYNYDEDHDGTIDSVLTVDEDLFYSAFEDMKTKRERGETYIMPSGTWAEETDAFQEFFIGKAVEEIEEFYALYCSDINGKPLKIVDASSAEDIAKYEALTDEEKAMLDNLTASASMSLNDAHGSILNAIINAYEVKEPIAVETVAAQGMGITFNGRPIGGGKEDAEGYKTYGFEEAFVSTLFDAEGRIVDIQIDQYELTTPNGAGAGQTHFSGWPGQEYTIDADHNKEVEGFFTITEESLAEEATLWISKSDRGDDYMIPAGSWQSQANFYEDLFKGMTIEEVKEWQATYCSDEVGKPLVITDKSSEADIAKYEALTDEQKAELDDIVAGASISLSDWFGHILQAMEKSYEYRVEVDITVG